ncbi:DNA replication ATP-dependent helicase/nuclease Dna2p [[Candida] railenensis]|uniref:DNA replication ATP-dependent helicase/nuclease DNA2 n=1 Tax=[Candida] railenensis TaxID=45579 RepID=A0A9P0QMS8_9ASCO|nr:DNA replication ATP-dependent helicase/nuclease Dna2p [[Candida] railenensis]
MEKRKRIDSPQKARVKPNKSKTKYFFQPVNKLSAPALQEQEKKREKEVPIPNRSLYQDDEDEEQEQQVFYEQEVHETPTKNIDYEKLIREQQSSDDSFDGVRWGGSPRKEHQQQGKRKSNVGNSSSPLRNVTSPILNEENKFSSATLLNEQVNSVLNKYGTGFHNILSQTPTLTRTRSDSSESKSKRLVRQPLPPLQSSPRGDKSPTLKRSKTVGLVEMSTFSKPVSMTKRDDKSEASKSSLKGWLSKFEVDKKATNEKMVIGTQELVDDIEFEDDFSDSLLEEEKVGEKIATGVNDIASVIDNKPLNSLEGAQNSVPFNAFSSQAILVDDDDMSFSSSSDSEAEQVVGKVEDDDDDDDDDDADRSSDPFSDDEDVNLIIPPQAKQKDSSSDSLQGGVKNLENLHLLTPFSNTSFQSDSLTENKSKLSYSRSDLKRFQIQKLIRNKFKIQNKIRDQIILTVRDGDNSVSNIMVRGEYTELDFQIGDVIHIICTNKEKENSHKLIDDQTNLLIWNPDILVSATTVSQQMSCPRKTVLVNRLRYPGVSSIPLLVGTIIHVIFQECLAKESWSDAFMDEVLERELEFHLLEIFSIGNELEKVRSELKAQFPYLKTWFDAYFKKPLSIKNSIPTNQRNQQALFSVNNVLDVEENIWSPMFGIKGMVDVTLEGSVKRSTNGAKPGKYLIPMEIKSGREHLSHHAQSSLYALLFKDRYDIDVKSFLLLYTKEKLLKLNDISQSDLKSLINLRNRITKYLKDDTRELPEIIRQSICDRCDVQKSCMTINKLVEDGDQEGSGLPDGIYDDLTSHLDGERKLHYRKFYNYWDDLLTKEESVITMLKKDLWTFTAKEREEQGGKALADLIITEKDDEDDSKRFTYTFERKSEEGRDSLQFSQLAKNDRVIISDEIGHFAIAQGYIVSIRSTYIVVSCERRIMTSSSKTESFNDNDHQTFQGVLHKTQQSAEVVSSSSKRSFRIDKDDMFHGMGLARYNILNLFMRGGDELRREVVVNLREPRFSQVKKNHFIDKDGHFNPDQINAFKKVLSAEDYCMILGMPGTGKTTVIAELIQFLMSKGKTILLASYTHSAVDNILIKMKDIGLRSIVRIGHPSRVHKDIQEFVIAPSKISNYSDFAEAYMEPLVFATTCLGIGDIAFSLRDRFDYCIIDEASQVSMPVSLGPLRFCEKFVLVGDHHQLPPLVQHSSAEVKAGLSQSLFKILSDKFPSSVAQLTYQYRMCEEIMQISNILTYDGRLKCGNHNVAKQSLHVPSPEKIDMYVDQPIEHRSKLWMDKILNPKNKVIFLNHDNLPGYERIVGEKVENPTEVELIYHIIESLTVCGVEESKIGVMSLYRAQLRLLNRTLFHKPNVEVLTADQFQGKDKDCIIISLVRSNKEDKVGDLLKEWRRINVAITRSKSKLIVLGSKSTLKNSETLDSFMEILESNGWMYDLEVGAMDVYKFSVRENQSPEKKRTSTSVTRISDKLIRNHPVLQDIVNDNKI